MKATDIAAWWGAILASLTLVWNIFRWHREQCKIRVRILPNMSISLPNGEQTGQKSIFVEASNVGGKDTTITLLGGYRCLSLSERLRRRSVRSFGVPLIRPGQSLPHIIRPGETWTGCIVQSAEIEKWAREETLYCGIWHSLSKRPVLSRVVIAATKQLDNKP
jgi:hypothetical protein